MDNTEKQNWAKALEETLRLFGYEGHVTYEDTEKRYRILMHHPAFKSPFIGEYTGIDKLFSVITNEHEYKDHNGLDRKHRESILYDGFTYSPLFYSICNGPEYQRIIIEDFPNRKKGDIVYTNSSISGGYRPQMLDAPIFDSEVFDVNMIICILTS